MSYLEQVEKNSEDRIAILKKALEDEPERLEVRKRLAVIFDEETSEVKPVYNWIGQNFEFRFSSVDEARTFTDALLEKLSIEKAGKVFEGWKDTPTWYYQIVFEGQNIKIEPAESSGECKPVPIASSSVHWVCQKK
jgi:hypothetical protein